MTWDEISNKVSLTVYVSICETEELSRRHRATLHVLQ